MKVASASVGGLVVLVALVGVYMYSTTGIPSALSSATQQSNVVYYSDGKTEIGTIGSTNRTDLTLAQIPVPLQDAFLAAEDKNFYHEGGVSPTGIMRALGSDLTSGGGSLNGGSTITQEFVRNYYGLGLQQTATRKVKEIIISEKLASAKSKQWILEHYLNMVFLGSQSYGVEAAAQTYFGKSASQLTIAEDAVLAGLPQSPSAYPLPQYKANLQTRWQYVLDQMVKDNYITAAQAAQQKFPTLLTWADPTRGQMAANVNPADGNPGSYYVLSMVQSELLNDGVTDGELSSGGYRIVTSLNAGMQKEMYNAVNTELSSSNLAANGSQYSKLPLWALVGAEVQNPKTGGIVAIYPGKGINQSTADCKLNACANNTVLSREQVGSSFKPYVVAAAVKQGMNVQTSTMDSSSYACIAPPSRGSTVFSQPVTASMYHRASSSTSTPTAASASSSSGCPAGYFPEENDSGESIGKKVAVGTGPYAGAVYNKDTVQDALAQSSNVAFTDLIHRTGTVDPESIAEAVGADKKAFEGDLGKTVGIALGEAPMTVDNQASMVAMLADNGTYHTSHVIQSWSNASAGTSGGPKVATTEVLTPAQASQVQYSMEMTTVDGTAKGLVTLSDPNNQGIIGKTGTTTSNHSGFFVGATPQYAMAVGMFTTSQDTSNKTQNLGMLDSSDAANIYPTMIWNKFMTDEFSSAPPQSFSPIDTTGTTAWNMFPALPKPPAQKPKPNPAKNKNPFCNNLGGPGGNHGNRGNGGNCPPSSPPVPSAPAQCGNVLFGCPSTAPSASSGAAPSSTATPTTTASAPPGKGNKPGG